jgi:exopolyphosphatase/guanosine-5'-triphosphate,3'-diphosphate pyrophosphatase
VNRVAALNELRAAMQRLEPEPEHTSHVAHLAVRLFDQLLPLHGLGPDDRILLEGAACLHDIGWPVSDGGTAHHKHSARLIRAQKWEHLTPAEADVVAQVARYHRRALPCAEHGDFHRLHRTRKLAVRHLAAILRLADAFDRSHVQAVRDVEVRIEPDRLEFTLRSRQPPLREIAAGEKKGDLAREIFDRKLLFRFEPLATRISLHESASGRAVRRV